MLRSIRRGDLALGAHEGFEVDESFFAAFEFFDVCFVADFEYFDFFALEDNFVAWFEGDDAEEYGDAVECVAFLVGVEGAAGFQDAAEFVFEFFGERGEVALGGVIQIDAAAYFFLFGDGCALVFFGLFEYPVEDFFVVASKLEDAFEVFFTRHVDAHTVYGENGVFKVSG